MRTACKITAAAVVPLAALGIGLGAAQGAQPARPAPVTLSASVQNNPPFTDASAVVVQYYQDVTDQNYAAAWAIGGNNLAALNGQSYGQWVAGYQDTTASINVNTASNFDSDTAEVTISAVQLDGTINTYAGTYTVTNGIITGADIQQTSPLPPAPPAPGPTYPNGIPVRDCLQEPFPPGCPS